jgi:hypothetical protein
MEPTLSLTNIGPARLSVDKLVLTTFISPDGSLAHYIEICADEPAWIEVTAMGTATARSARHLYLDQRASGSMYKDYALLDVGSGRHHQAVGTLDLVVAPVDLEVTEQSAPNGHSATSFRVAQPAVPPQEDSWGGWLIVEQGRPATVRYGTASLRAETDLRLCGLTVANLYWFVVLPSGYRSTFESFQCVPYPRKLQVSEPKRQAVMEYELTPDFAVYGEWASRIYDHTILKNRRPLTVPEDSTISFSTRAVDEVVSGRLGATSFLSGIVLAVASNVLVSAAFRLADRGWSPAGGAVVAASLAATSLGALLGWRALRGGR